MCVVYAMHCPLAYVEWGGLGGGGWPEARTVAEPMTTMAVLIMAADEVARWSWSVAARRQAVVGGGRAPPPPPPPY